MKPLDIHSRVHRRPEMVRVDARAGLCNGFEWTQCRLGLEQPRLGLVRGACPGLGVLDASLAFAVVHALKHRFDGVVITLRDRIEFVVVTTRAADREPEESSGRRADDVVQLVRALVPGQDFIGTFHLVPRPSDQKTGGLIRAQHVAGDLLENEVVVWFVLGEGVNDVVAVRPGVGARLVHFKTVGFGETNDIEPVSGPAFAEAR